MLCQVGEGLGVLHNREIDLKSCPCYQDFYQKSGAFVHKCTNHFFTLLLQHNLLNQDPRGNVFAAEVMRLRAKHHWKFMECSQPDLLNGNIKSHRQAPRWLPPRYIQQVYMNRLFQADVD